MYFLSYKSTTTLLMAAELINDAMPIIVCF